MGPKLLNYHCSSKYQLWKPWGLSKWWRNVYFRLYYTFNTHLNVYPRLKTQNYFSVLWKNHFSTSSWMCAHAMLFTSKVCPVSWLAWQGQSERDCGNVGKRGGKKTQGINKVSGNVKIISDALLFWQSKPFLTEPSLTRAKTPQLCALGYGGERDRKSSDCFWLTQALLLRCGLICVAVDVTRDKADSCFSVIAS